MSEIEAVTIKAQALRDFADKYEHLTQVLFYDWDTDQPVRISDLARMEADRIEAGAP